MVNVKHLLTLLVCKTVRRLNRDPVPLNAIRMSLGVDKDRTKPVVI